VTGISNALQLALMASQLASQLLTIIYQAQAQGQQTVEIGDIGDRLGETIERMKRELGEAP
jgi:hypothetical protein